MSFDNVILGYLLNGTYPFIETRAPAVPSYDISEHEVLGRWLRKRLVRNITCVKMDAQAIIAGFSLEQHTVTLDAGVDYAGAEQLVDWADGWDLAAITPTDRSPSFVDLGLTYERENSARLELDLPSGLVFTHTAGVIYPTWNGVVMADWDSGTGVNGMGLQVRGELSYTETRYQLADGTSRTGVRFTATVTSLVDEVPLTTMSVTEQDYPPLVNITTESGDARLICLKDTYDAIRKELYWSVNGTVLTFMFWDKPWWEWDSAA